MIFASLSPTPMGKDAKVERVTWKKPWPGEKPCAVSFCNVSEKSKDHIS